MTHREIMPEALQGAVRAIMDDYAADITEATKKAVKKIVDTGKKELRAASGAFGGTGRYAAGWTSRMETGRLSAQGVVYNKLSGLPHLLEHGHKAVAHGRTVGFTQGRTHIAPVEQSMTEAYRAMLEEAARGS